ncbi:hypothetical protein [Trinickia dinghuensis]|uniref:Uncharacterized protein n=1 Tax=Trinickia dinghuensis TaxID=2291023 RepID=A0A3D8JRP0_9BURK|nr:hypothetical protein [Trinickia dinghuensis]RDU95452.1 hypothetical protein DWV00_28175 [Trinickia dinghuensis]
MKLRTLGIVLATSLMPVAASVFLLFAIVFRHYDGDTGSCPTQPYEVTKKHIADYLKANNKPTNKVVFEDDAHYDNTTNWWMVPFRVNSTRYEAMVDCHGGIEITGALK